MKNSRWLSPRRTWALGLACLAVAAMGLAGGPADGTIALSCTKLCRTTLQVDGAGTFAGDMIGSLTAAPGKAFLAKNGLRTVPIEILGSAMRGQMEGVGEVMMWLDKSRPVEGSELRENRAGGGFPATQVMKTHMLMTIEAEPGRTFRSVNPLVVLSSNVTSFPPRGVLYRVASKVEFEDVDRPGEVAVRVLSGRVTINPVERLGPQGHDRTTLREEEGR